MNDTGYVVFFLVTLGMVSMVGAVIAMEAGVPGQFGAIGGFFGCLGFHLLLWRRY